MKTCKRCGERKAIFLFPKNSKATEGHTNICKKCENKRQMMAREIAKDWKYPYTGFKDPEYIKDKAETFARNAKIIRKDLGLNW